MNPLSTATAVAAAAGLIIAQVILPAAFDLIGSLAIFAAGAVCGWKVAKART